jgi:hypothetical protein
MKRNKDSNTGTVAEVIWKQNERKKKEKRKKKELSFLTF